MSETKTEIKQGEDYTERKEFLENYSINDLLDIIYSYDEVKSVKNLLLEYILDRDYDLKWRAE